MSISSDAQISYGVLIEEEGMADMLPWIREGGEEFGSWWLRETGFEHSFEIYDGKGDYVNGMKPPDNIINKYYEEEDLWMKDHPFPFEEVNYCSSDTPMYILAIPGTTLTASRGYPAMFNPTTSLFGMERQTQRLLDFCEKYNIKYTKGPGWFLSSYWG